MRLATKAKENCYLEQVSLSDIDLYYSSEKVINGLIKITGEECHHIKDVMRHKTGDEIYVTNGKGSIFNVRIEQIGKNEISCSILEEKQFENKLEKIVFCIPRLKSAERFEFALEKCVELGITKFIVFESTRTIAKGEKLERWQKVLHSAMKQSLRAWQPKISYAKSINELMNLDGKKIIFEQNSELQFRDFLSTFDFQLSTLSYFIFGPEGGLTSAECRVRSVDFRMRLSKNRLRTETAIVTTAAILSSHFL